MPEKLLTIQEVARYLKISEEEVKRLVDIGEIPAYKIGGTFLRFRKEQIEAIRQEISSFETKESPQSLSATQVGPREYGRHPYTDLEKEIKRREPVSRQYDYTFFERLRDLWYFSDFYIVSALIVAAVVYIIVKV
jgi:excisionase family DNA binding protein